MALKKTFKILVGDSGKKLIDLLLKNFQPSKGLVEEN